jgi:hypothetical protein
MLILSPVSLLLLLPPKVPNPRTAIITSYINYWQLSIDGLENLGKLSADLLTASRRVMEIRYVRADPKVIQRSPTR